MIENDLIAKELFCQLDHGEILHTISAAKAIGMTADEFRGLLGERVTTSLNHDREYIASREYVSEHCDRKGFWRKGGKVFNVKGGISEVLYHSSSMATSCTSAACGRRAIWAEAT